MRYAVIDACARGDRLRPLTNREMPTAFLPLGDRRTLLQRVIDRLSGIVLAENIWVLVEPRLRARAEAELDNAIHIATSGRGETEALGKALSEIASSEAEAFTLLMESATHVVKDEARFRECLREGFDMAAARGQGVSFTASGRGEGQRSTGIQCWPSAQLSVWLASHATSGKGSVSGTLAPAAESQLTSLPLSGSGWSEVDDWDSVRHLLGYVEKPWGHERLWALNQNYAGKILFIKAGESLSLQYHEMKGETIRIASGRMRFRVGPSLDRLETHILDPGMSYEISTRIVHQMEAIEDCTVIEVSTPHLTDVVRLEDRYGRN